MTRSILILALLVLTNGSGPKTAIVAEGIRPAASRPAIQTRPEFTYDHGGIVRGPRDRKQMALIFTGGSFGEGTPHILDELAARRIKGSFFVTGEFLRKPEHVPLLKRIIAEGHYVGPHSDAHLLYCPWDDRARTLVTREQFRADLRKNMADLAAVGAFRDSMRFFVPPYEWYNEQIVAWAAEMGMVLVNLTPGTRSSADYLPDTDRRFISSREIYESILARESREPQGLNGFLLLLHLGATPARTDKMHVLIGPLLDELSRRGYKMVRIDQLLGADPGTKAAPGPRNR